MMLTIVRVEGPVGVDGVLSKCMWLTGTQPCQGPQCLRLTGMAKPSPVALCHVQCKGNESPLQAINDTFL